MAVDAINVGNPAHMPPGVTPVEIDGLRADMTRA